MVAMPIQAGRRQWIMYLCAKAFSFTLLTMIVIHHRLTTASKPAAKHAKPSSLKYADTSKRKQRKKNTYIYLCIYSIGKGSGGGGGEEGGMGVG